MAHQPKYSPEVRERAVRMVFEHESVYSSQWEAIRSIATKIGCTAETLRKWVRRTEIDTGRRNGVTSDERARLLFAAGYVLAENRLVSRVSDVFFISEAWMSTFDKEAYVPPSRDPQRREVLLVSGLDMHSGQSELRLYEMQRDDDGALIGLDAVEVPDADEERVESWLLSAFAAGYRAGGDSSNFMSSARLS